MAVRVTQIPVEVLADADPEARISQLPVEVLANADPNARISQLPVEVLANADPNARISQIPVEVVVQDVGQLRITQFAVEVLQRTVYGGPIVRADTGSLITNALLHWDTQNNRMAIGTQGTPVKLSINATDAIIIPIGTTAQQPSTASDGMIRFNSDDSLFEAYDGTIWGNITSMPPIILDSDDADLNLSITAAAEVTRNDREVLAFDDATTEGTCYELYMPKNYGGGDINVNLVWAADSATSGDVRWGIQIERMAEADIDIDSSDFDTTSTTDDTTQGTAGQLTYTTIAKSPNNTEAGEAFRMIVTRVGGNGADTMTGDAHLYRIIISEG